MGFVIGRHAAIQQLRLEDEETLGLGRNKRFGFDGEQALGFGFAQLVFSAASVNSFVFLLDADDFQSGDAVVIILTEAQRDRKWPTVLQPRNLWWRFGVEAGEEFDCGITFLNESRAEEESEDGRGIGFIQFSLALGNFTISYWSGFFAEES